MSYRTIQKLFDVLNFRKTQYNSTRNISVSPRSKKSSTNTSAANTGGRTTPTIPPVKSTTNSTKSHKRLVADTLNSTSQSFEFMNPLKGKSQQINVDPVDFMLDEIDEVDDVEEEAPVEDGDDPDSDNVVGFEYTIELSMMEIYNEQVGTNISLLF